MLPAKTLSVGLGDALAGPLAPMMVMPTIAAVAPMAATRVLVLSMVSLS
jgi:hypothetical protein